ncbi:MAG: two-component regulator propeller domain-containing protein, partial [Bacteroidota bacterium]
MDKRIYKSILIIIFNCFGLLGQETILNLNDLSFKHISSKEGLSQRSITDILQDNKGYLWFGTRDGLNKYDGSKISVYRHSSVDTTSLTHSWIKCLFQDTKNNVWIGTREGLNRYNPVEDLFVQYNKGPNESLKSEIWSITQLNDSVLSVATSNALSFIDLRNNTFYDVAPSETVNKEGFFKSEIRNILTAKNGDLWICTVNKIHIYSPLTNAIVNIDYPENAIKEAYLNNSPTVFEDNQSNIWLGYDKGLALFDKDLRVFKDYV